MLFWCWANVEDGGPTLKQHWFNIDLTLIQHWFKVSCLLGCSGGGIIFYDSFVLMKLICSYSRPSLPRTVPFTHCPPHPPSTGGSEAVCLVIQLLYIFHLLGYVLKKYLWKSRCRWHWNVIYIASLKSKCIDLCKTHFWCWLTIWPIFVSTSMSLDL